MSTTSFGEHAIATLENQVDTSRHPADPAPQGQAQDLADRHLVRRAAGHHRGRALPAGLAVLLHVQAEQRVRLEPGPAPEQPHPRQLRQGRPRASPACRCGGSSRTRFIIAAGSVIGVVLSSRAGRLRVRPHPVQGPRRPVRRDDRHAAAAVPRLIIPQYIIFNRLDLIDTFIAAAAAEVPRHRGVLRLPAGAVHPADAPRHGRGGPHRRRRPLPDLLVDHPAADQARPDHLLDLRVHLGLERLPRTPALPHQPRELPAARSRCASTTTRPSTSDYGATVTASFIALLPVLLFFLVFQRFLVDGVATQGLRAERRWTVDSCARRSAPMPRAAARRSRSGRPPASPARRERSRSSARCC